MVNPDLWVDALTDWGIVIIFGQHWVAWKLKPSWKVDGCKHRLGRINSPGTGYSVDFPGWSC